MDHVAKLSSAALAIFDEELRDALAPIAEFAGPASLPRVVKSTSLSRTPARIDVDFLFMTSIYQRRLAGHLSCLGDVPAMNDPTEFVKEKADARFRKALSPEVLRGKVRGHVVADEAYALTRLNCGCGNGTERSDAGDVAATERSSAITASSPRTGEAASNAGHIMGTRVPRTCAARWPGRRATRPSSAWAGTPRSAARSAGS
jgi:hypothetical protein